MNNTNASDRTLLFLVALCFLLCSQAVRAQYCASSQLNYIVRDARGKIINPGTLDAPDFIEESVMAVDYAEAEKKREGYWALGEVVKNARAEKAGGLDKETGKLFTLHTGSVGCNFLKPIMFKLTLGDQTMNVEFRFAQPRSDVGKVFLVDSIPFEQGTFTIELPQQSGYYSTWTKTSDEAVKPAPIASHHIRGRIINAVTKKPVANAVVTFETIPIYYGKHDTRGKSNVKTDARGHFAFEDLRGDYFQSITKAAVFVEHPDFAVGTNAYLLDRVSENGTADRGKKAIVSGKDVRLESQDDLTIELVPLVTVSGRVVGASGDSLPDAANLPKEFTVTTSYGEGGYLGGSLSVPRGEVRVNPHPDGTFTFKTAPGKNEFGAGGKLGGKTYNLVGNRTALTVGDDGLKGVVLKIERAPWEIRDEFNALMKQGNDQFAAGRLDASLIIFKEAARLKPGDTTGHYTVIQTYAALKRIDEAITVYRQAVAAKPEDAVYHYGLGLSLDRAGKIADAVKSYKESVRLAPDVALYHYNLGNTLGTLGQADAAIRELGEAIRLNPKHVDSYTVLGMEYYNLGRYDDAITQLTNALRLDPKNDYALPSRCPTYLIVNRNAEAAADAERFIAAYGWKHEQSIYMALFGSLGNRFYGKDEGARKLLEIAANNIDKSSWPAPAVEFLLGRLPAADLLKMAVDNDKMTEARSYIGLDLLLSGKREEALPHLSWVITNGNKTFHEYHFVKAVLERPAR